MAKLKFQKVDKKDANKGKSFHKREPKKSTIINPSFHFYKDDAYGKDIENFNLTKIYEEMFKIDGLKDGQTFELTTTYPGLLIGSGYNHPKLKDNDEDFQLGFFFDHTTGLPIVSGSSIKGAIRSIFPDKNDRYKDEKREFLKDIYGIEDSDKKIEELFEGGKVVFYDAYISKTANKNSLIFGDDYITTHHSDEEFGELKEPTPIRFLKILPEVTFRFQFSASTEQVDFFEKILKDFGIGAKTNVGYGQFVDV